MGKGGTGDCGIRPCSPLREQTNLVKKGKTAKPKATRFFPEPLQNSMRVSDSEKQLSRDEAK